MTIRLKHIALLIVIALTIGCSKDDGDMLEGNSEQVPTIAETPISFSAKQQEEEAVTRAEALKNYVTTFTVYGYKNMDYDYANGYGGLQQVFPGYTVNWTDNSAHTTTTNSDGWEYVDQQASGEKQTVKYWDLSARAYRFFGVTEKSGTTVTTGANVATGATGPAVLVMNDIDASIDSGIEAMPYFSRLWFSTGNTTLGFMPFCERVQLVFVKPYCRVRFMFTYSYPDANVTLTEKSFAPMTTGRKIHSKGTFTISYPLTGDETNESFTVTEDTSGDLSDFTQDYYETPDDLYARTWYTVLPANAADQGPYILSVKVNGDAKTAVVPQEYMNWLPGYEYTYVFKITEEGGVTIDMVNAAFATWTPMMVSYIVYNW